MVASFGEIKAAHVTSLLFLCYVPPVHQRWEKNPLIIMMKWFDHILLLGLLLANLYCLRSYENKVVEIVNRVLYLEHYSRPVNLQIGDIPNAIPASTFPF